MATDREPLESPPYTAHTLKAAKLLFAMNRPVSPDVMCLDLPESGCWMVIMLRTDWAGVRVRSGQPFRA